MLKHKNALLVLGIVFIASNLRTPLTGWCVNMAHEASSLCASGTPP
jgi:cyanate permease